MIESALVINLFSSLKWESSIEPPDGNLSYPPETIFSSTNLSRRARELRYRDGVVASNAVDVSIKMGDVWSAPQNSIQIQGAYTRTLDYALNGVGYISTKVRYLNNSDKLSGTRRVEDDLQGRDAMVYEALARACRSIGLEGSPPLIDPGLSSIPSIVEWSLASGNSDNVDFNASMAISKDDMNSVYRNLADRDNVIAGYVARLIKIIENPFEFASRIYVAIDGPGTRDPEVYTLVYPRYKPGKNYVPGDEVFSSGKWYSANVVTSNSVTSGDWTEIVNPTRRVWNTIPALSDRSAIIYDTVSKTLQWIGEDSDTIHMPRLISLCIDGVESGQKLRTVVQLPNNLDSYHWYKKSGRVVLLQSSRDDYRIIDDTRNAVNGLRQEKSNSLSVRGKTKISLGEIEVGRYRVSVLCQANTEVVISGGDNLNGISGTEGGFDFSGAYRPSSTQPGISVDFNVPLNNGSWDLYLEYTNLSGTTGGFGVEVLAYPGSVSNSGIVAVKSRTIPYYFVDENGVPLVNGTLVRSGPIAISPTGSDQTYSVRWVNDNGGLFHIRRLIFVNTNFKDSRYSIELSLEDDNLLVGNSGRSEFQLQDKDYGVFTHSVNVSSPLTSSEFVLDWTDGGGIPLIINKIQLQKINNENKVTPDAYGFRGWRRMCLEKAVECLKDSYKKVVDRFIEVGEVKSYTVDGVWTRESSMEWYSCLETYAPRFRFISSIENGCIVNGRYYRVSSGSLVYDGVVYGNGDLFYGVDGIESWSGVATVAQEGSFVIAGPGHVGLSGILPRGTSYESGVVLNDFNSGEQSPELVTIMPWMVSIGIYAAREGFVN